MAIELLSQLTTKFEAKVTSDVSSYLGIKIHQLKDGSIFINQASYVQKILHKFGMLEANPVSTPMETGWKASESLAQKERYDKKKKARRN